MVQKVYPILTTTFPDLKMGLWNDLCVWGVLVGTGTVAWAITDVVYRILKLPRYQLSDDMTTIKQLSTWALVTTLVSTTACYFVNPRLALVRFPDTRKVMECFLMILNVSGLFRLPLPVPGLTGVIFGYFSKTLTIAAIFGSLFGVGAAGVRDF